MARVATLLKGWASDLGHGQREVDRWTALGFLHDALRDADPETLRPLVPPALQSLDGKMLHGPAAAERLAADGVTDRPLLDAVAFHTLGYAGFEDLGRALYAADFLEPGRRFEGEWRASLRARMPRGLKDVVQEILAARIRRMIDDRRTIRPETMEFWNATVRGEEWAGVSAR